MANKWTAGKYHAESKIVEFQDSVGNCLFRQGGSLCWRLNNPGNLRPAMRKGVPHPTKVTSHIGFAKTSSNGYFFIFPDAETGYQEVKANLKRLHSQETVQKAIQSYAPKNDHNRPEKYAQDLENESGISAQRLVSSLSDSELDKLAKSIGVIEGYNNSPDGARVEKPGKISTVTTSDGARPITGVKVKLSQSGKEKTVTSSAGGQLPPILHPPGGGSMDVLIKSAKGIWEKVLSIDLSGPGKNYLAVFDGLVASTHTQLHVAPANTQPGKKRPFPYIVQPGDTLAKIASRFKTTADVLAQANGIKNPNKIYPGESLQVLVEASSASDITPKKQEATAPVAEKAPAATSRDSQSNTSAAQATTQSSGSVTKSTGGGSAAASQEPSGGKQKVSPTRDNTKAPVSHVNADQKRAPWMALAVEEGHTWKGADESEITKTQNYFDLEDLQGTDVHGKPTQYDLHSTPWCAAFVSYCLNRSGASAAKGVSSQFPTVNKKAFIKIDKPIYGAIMVRKDFKKKGDDFIQDYGGHITFVYGKSKDGGYVCLGGNQHDRIKFSNYHDKDILKTKIEIIKNPDTGEKTKKEIVIKEQRIFGFYVPIAYADYAKKESTDLDIYDAKRLNKDLLGFKEEKVSKNESTT